MKNYLSGSLYKFKNDGLHNYDQFNQSDFNLAIKLNKEFFVKPSELCRNTNSTIRIQ